MRELKSHSPDGWSAGRRKGHALVLVRDVTKLMYIFADIKAKVTGCEA